MGGSEASSNQFLELDPLSKDDITQFEQSGHPGSEQAAMLYNKIVQITQTKNGAQNVYYSAGGHDITQLYQTFQGFKGKYDKLAKDAKDYQAAANAAPGRDQTILGYSKERQDAASILGAPSKGTVLG